MSQIQSSALPAETFRGGWLGYVKDLSPIPWKAIASKTIPLQDWGGCASFQVEDGQKQVTYLGTIDFQQKEEGVKRRMCVCLAR